MIESMDFQCQTVDGSLIEPQTCIFPILKEVGPGEAALVGTGFFLTTLGHFVTARHVILDAFDQKTGLQKSHLHALHFVVGVEALVRHITKVSFHNTSDIAVGKMDFHVLTATGEPLTNRVPRFTTETPRPGSNVVTFAYPESDWNFQAGGGSSFVPKYYSGQFLYSSDRPRDSVMVSWPHFATSIKVMGGASGGPVFDENGRVFGINSVGGMELLSYMPRIAELLPLTVPEFSLEPGCERELTVAELAKTGHIFFEPAIN